MIKKLLFIIGLTLLLPLSVHAQDEPPPILDCLESLQENEFTCAALGVKSYCSGSPIEDLYYNLETDFFPQFNIYRNSYCGVTRDNSDEVIAIVAEQLGAEDAAFNNPDLVKFILTELQDKSLAQFMDENGLNEENIPAQMRFAFFGKEANYAEQQRIGTRVRQMYENEKIMYQKKESLKVEFENREVFANASLADAPFDLIVDLNLIEIVLFGSLATWEENVYSFPRQDGIDALDVQEAITPEVAAATDAPETETASDEADAETDDPEAETPEEEAPIEQYECLTPEELEAAQADPGGGVFALQEHPEPDADIQAQVPGQVPEGCGNLLQEEGEECDDGNNIAGDGCSEGCLLEMGNSLSCNDPEAVTFQQYEPEPIAGDVQAQEEGDESGATGTLPGGAVGTLGPIEIPISCPPGSTPVVTGPEGTVLPDGSVVQSANFPGPFVGGVLRQYPPSNRPPCPTGHTELEITFAGINTTESTCVPIEMCGSFEDARVFLFGPDYADDPVTKAAAEAIEAMVCVEVHEINRPESPYPVNEGCVDCHILAMNDIMAEMLGKQVAPLENNMEAWGSSSRWGPNFSFEVDVVVGPIQNLLIPPKLDEISEEEKAKLKGAQVRQDGTNQLFPNQTVAAPTTIADVSVDSILEAERETDRRAQEHYEEELRQYRAVSEGETADQTFYHEVYPMVMHMLKSFERLQSAYHGLSETTKLNTKQECEI